MSVNVVGRDRRDFESVRIALQGGEHANGPPES
jgi:hypothetical protein